MSESSEQTKRLTMAFDPRARAKESLLLIFAGLETLTAGTISVDAIQKRLFESYPELLVRFPQYDSYFAISTWVAFFAGLFFLLFPMSITLWIGRYLVGMSLAYIVLGTKGVASAFPVPFYVVYWISVLSPMAARLNTIGFYHRHTSYDLPIYIVMSLGQLFWGLYEFWSFRTI